MRKRILALVGAVSILAAGCTSSSRHASGITLPVATTVPAGPNPDVIPAVITPAYVDAVFRVLNHIYGDASRLMLSERAVTPGVLTDLRAIYDDPLYSQEVKIARQSLAESLSNVRRPPGDIVTTVLRVISASPSCTFVQTSSSYANVLVDPSPPEPSEYWVLEPKATGIDPDHLNPTPWALARAVVFTTPTSVSNQCTNS